MKKNLRAIVLSVSFLWSAAPCGAGLHRRGGDSRSPGITTRLRAMVGTTLTSLRTLTRTLPARSGCALATVFREPTLGAASSPRPGTPSRVRAD
jgi:hypothetical protein